ncbi:hypothetical protein D3C87_829340 [compost metagenome]
MTEAATTLEQEDSQNTRIRNLEIRVEALEKRLLITDSALERVITLVRESSQGQARKLLETLSGVFHGLSDQLTAIATVPTADQYGVQRVDEGTPGSVVVTRKGNEYTFANSEQPELLITHGTEILVDVFNRKQCLADGDTAWFTLFLDSKVPNDGIPAAPTGEDEVSA